MELANKSQKEELAGWMLQSNIDENKKIKAVTAIYNSLDIKEITQQKIDAYFSSASENINNLSLGIEQKKQLNRLSQLLLNRKS